MLLCTNTLHKVSDIIEGALSIPFIHIADATGEAIAANSLRKVGLLGTRYTMDGPVYPAVLTAAGIEARVPRPEERAEINRIIFEELVEGRATPEALAYFQKVIARLRDEEGCDGVVLGCTEIPILVPPEASPLPTLDSTRLLAKAAVDHALGEGWVSTRPTA